MDIDKKTLAPDVEDRSSVCEGKIDDHSPASKPRPESLRGLGAQDIEVRARKLVRKMDLFSQCHFPRTMYLSNTLG